MARSLSYADAARLLGGQNSKIITALEKIAGVLMLGTAPVADAVLSWFDAKADFVRLSNELVRNLAEHRSGLSRYGRTERLEAAHTVIVVTAFFEALTEMQLPVELAEMELTKAEQLAVARRAASRHDPVVLGPGPGTFLATVMSNSLPMPTPQEPPEAFLTRLRRYYVDLAKSFGGFVTGLALGDQLPRASRELFDVALRLVPDHACARYQDSFRTLAAEFPEVARWASQHEQRATRAALAAVEETLLRISTGQAPGVRRAALTDAYRAALNEPIVETGNAPGGIHMPSLGQAYRPSRFRVSDVLPGVRVSDEQWWSGLPVRDDIEDFLIGHLTSPQASRAPLLVLGQPGSGKSVLTKVLAARLPAADFLPVRVELRSAPAAADLQDQLEHAIRAATGDRVEWPGLVGSSGDAMPVILLDGFDELLQALGVSQSDYLTRVADFQRREATQGRPVAVLVTTRTAVADRAQAPEHAVAIRLEPFDRKQVTDWLEVWNATNASVLAARGLAPLTPAAALTHPELAEQPLLLLMLALYDADANALQRGDSDLRADQLYERLLRSFAVREVRKSRSDLSERELAAAVENELLQLSVVAFAMFNRAALWISEDDLDRDLTGFLGMARAKTGADLRTPLRAADLAIGRFFFIHRARSEHGEQHRGTYEFLHATFGEFFVARLTWQILRAMAARETVTAGPFAAETADDGRLRALLSYEPLSLRQAVIRFLRAMMAESGPAELAALRGLLLRLFRSVPYSPPDNRYTGYRPCRHSEPGKYAVYSANLLLLIACAGDEVSTDDLFPGIDPVRAWSSQALLWQSQFSDDTWHGFVRTLTIERLWDGDRRVMRLGMDDGSWVTPALDMYWTFGFPPENHNRRGFTWNYVDLHGEALRRSAHFVGGRTNDALHNALEPMTTGLGIGLNTFVGWSADACPSAAHTLLRLLMTPLDGSRTEHRETTYHQAAKIISSDFPQWSDDDYLRYGSALLALLAADPSATPRLTAHVLRIIGGSTRTEVVNALASGIIRCALRFLGSHHRSDLSLAMLIADVIDRTHAPIGWTGRLLDHLTAAEVVARLKDLGLAIPRVLIDRFATAEAFDEVARQRPDLARSLREIRRAERRP
ncbi:NACHT domain-containing protein [Actinoplanes utahensis]|uniref:NACHT domain-containing protein n=1 Tax=Actinoplanes utahensis TaxID=1869 RepID=UPI00068973FA|nr:ATP-binding protein [Actinoplanes utahensis]GIF31979.1 hypothetical protein Aut01nite_49650 [Actinoplanes utahensis]